MLYKSYEDFSPEKNHTTFCKFLIGANKYSTYLACKSEDGRCPLAILATLFSIKYWMHINDDEIPKAHNKFTFQSLINRDEKRQVMENK